MTARLVQARNVNGALQDGLWWLKVAGVHEDSRNGPVLVAPAPVITEYLRPTERVLFSAVRDANPFFHLMEALWMVSGRNDVAWLAGYNQRMATYSDDGEYLHGAYGFRWREWFGFDQLRRIVEHLREDPKSRRAVLTMWSPNGDLVSSEGMGGLSSKDVPCNTHCYVDLREGGLNMSVLCRSNDAIWGAYGANAVHFSFLQEYLAMQLRVPVGRLWQVSHNLHVYTQLFGEEKLERLRTELQDAYSEGEVAAYPLLGEQEDFPSWERDINRFMSAPVGDDNYYCNFFRHVAQPMRQAWRLHKGGDSVAAMNVLAGSLALDWRKAGLDWLQRRIQRKEAA